MTNCPPQTIPIISTVPPHETTHFALTTITTGTSFSEEHSSEMKCFLH